MRRPDISNTRFIITILISIAIFCTGLYLWLLILTPTCKGAYCTPVTCISSAGCIAPCFCAKQQGEAYGVCSGAGHE